MCKSRNIQTYIHLYPKTGEWEFKGGGGVCNAEIFNAMYEAKLEIPSLTFVHENGNESP